MAKIRTGTRLSKEKKIKKLDDAIARKRLCETARTGNECCFDGLNESKMLKDLRS